MFPFDNRPCFSVEGSLRYSVVSHTRRAHTYSLKGSRRVVTLFSMIGISTFLPNSSKNSVVYSRLFPKASDVSISIGYNRFRFMDPPFDCESGFRFRSALVFHSVMHRLSLPCNTTFFFSLPPLVELVHQQLFFCRGISSPSLPSFSSYVEC